MPKELHEYDFGVAKIVEQPRQLFDEGFDYITEIDGMKLFRERK